MTEFTLYSYQCCPIRPNVSHDGRRDMFECETREADRMAMENMENHQSLIDKMLTTDLERHFESQRESSKQKGHYDKCLAFCHGKKHYYFKMLLPHEGKGGNGCYMLRIANPRKQQREVDFVRMLMPDEPSALVIIDNRKDQQRILIERTRAWKDTDAVRNILQACLGGVLRQRYRLGIRIEPVWQKNTFENIVRIFGDRIKSIDFYVGYPNMGRTGDKFLNPLKESLKNTYASCSVKYKLPTSADLGSKKKRRNSKETEEEQRKTLCIEADNIDPVMNEIVEHCRIGGLPITFGLISGHQISLQRVPETQLKRMTPEKRKLYEQETKVYSTYTVSMSDSLRMFDGQDDLFGGVQQGVMDKLNDLRDNNV